MLENNGATTNSSRNNFFYQGRNRSISELSPRRCSFLRWALEICRLMMVDNR